GPGIWVLRRIVLISVSRENALTRRGISLGIGILRLRLIFALGREDQSSLRMTMPRSFRHFHRLHQYQPIGASLRLMSTCFVSRYSSMPQGPSARPKPDCLYPPQGAST